MRGEFLSRYQADARKKGYEWDITPEQLWAKWLAQEGRCIYTGWELEHGKNASIDRISSKTGYVPGNVQWVHKDINWLKNKFAEEYFVELCKAVADHARGDL